MNEKERTSICNYLHCLDKLFEREEFAATTLGEWDKAHRFRQYRSMLGEALEVLSPAPNREGEEK